MTSGFQRYDEERNISTHMLTLSNQTSRNIRKCIRLRKNKSNTSSVVVYMHVTENKDSDQNAGMIRFYGNTLAVE